MVGDLFENIKKPEVLHARESLKMRTVFLM